ncbi:MAG: hypothetical protein MUE51_14420 [Thermoleophilia bacterium]|jgi:hypothetical protein|nr:hypothetical protein [Thermoleophilia bacterium]
MENPFGHWLMPPVGATVRQLVAHGPFVVQRRHDMGYGGCLLTRHRDALRTAFRILGYTERSEIGLSCHVVLLEDAGDGEPYVVDTGLMGPGLPPDAFALVSP